VEFSTPVDLLTVNQLFIEKKPIMKGITMLKMIMLSSALLISSCSSDPEPDPCEGITCVNGDCNNGSCLCENGWMGQDCSVKDFSGEWRMIQYTLNNCPNYFATDITGDGKTRQLCGKAEEFDVCYETYFNFNSNGTYTRNEALYLHNDDGTIETIRKLSDTGTWVTEDNGTKVRTRTDGTSGFRLFTVLADGKIDRLEPEPDGGSSCSIKEVYLQVLE